MAFRAVGFIQKGRRPDSYQPGATPQVGQEIIIGGLKARAIHYGAGFQPSILFAQ
jgi:hypothetical protein